MFPHVTVILPCKGIDCFYARRLERFAAQEGFPHVLLIPDRPYGAAIHEGVRGAQTPWVATMDTDGQHTWADLRAVCDALGEGLDMVVGCRGPSFTPRGLASQYLNLAASILAGAHVPDGGSGLRVFQRQVVLPLLERLPQDFSFNAALTLTCLLHRHRVAWLHTPRRARMRGRSFIRVMDGFRTMQTLLALRNGRHHR